MPLPATLKILTILLYAGSASAHTPGGSIDNPRYDLETSKGPDAAAGGWMINLGITGLRVRLEEDAPKSLTVGHVFPNSPADGRIAVGDVITGIDGRPFTVAHTFGYGMDAFGYEGPLMDFANALESCQATGASGTLALNFTRAGTAQQATLAIGTDYGAYAPTYPFKCAKTDRVLRELMAYIAERQLENGTWGNRQHLNAFAALALLASGDERYRPHTTRAARAFAERTADTIDYRGYDCWTHSLYGIYLAEYYLATREAWVLPELEEINRWMPKAQMANGGWGHRPADRPGGNGYGAINILAMQCKAAWALMKRCGLEIDEAGFKAAHEFTDRGTNQIGYVWYADGIGGKGYADMGRTGIAAIAHALTPEYPGYRAFAERSARCIGTHSDTFSDTHGSPILGMGWTALGAGADPASFRKLMDDNRWWFTLAQCREGTFYYQPNRDNNPQDFEAAPRLSASAATALILAMRDRRLAIMNLAPALPTDARDP